jgi:tungstate transport system substrate-binding protein
MACNLRAPPETALPSFRKGDFVFDVPLPVVRPRPFFLTREGAFCFRIQSMGDHIMKKMLSILLITMCILQTAWASQKTVILATTTSTQDSGLLDVLLPVFEKEGGYLVKTISVGSGQAMKMGEKGEADVLLVHSPDAEKKFMTDGFGTSRRLVMHNDFIVVGPATDPANIKTAAGSVDAFKRMAQNGALFASRGDNSGTHAKEKTLWKAAAVNPEGQKWYQQTGLGMGQTLNVAAEKKGYSLTDRATYLSLRKNLGMAILMEGDSKLLNIYHVIEINSVRWPKVNAAGGKAFADFMVAPKTQDLIGKFGAEKFGAPLFFPDADKKSESLGL